MQNGSVVLSMMMTMRVPRKTLAMGGALVVVSKGGRVPGYVAAVLRALEGGEEVVVRGAHDAATRVVSVVESAKRERGLRVSGTVDGDELVFRVRMKE